ncbi:Uncharacterised protein [Klebsiella pneumoniae]|nr:Uncharacterised protein [Klebsiella pneumoniae]
MENRVTHFPDHQRDGFLRLLQQGRLNRQCAFRRKAGQQRDTDGVQRIDFFRCLIGGCILLLHFFIGAQHHTALYFHLLARPGNHHSDRLLHFIRPCPVFCPVRDGLLFFPDGFQSPGHDVIIHAGVLVFILSFQSFQLCKTF